MTGHRRGLFGLLSSVGLVGAAAAIIATLTGNPGSIAILLLLAVTSAMLAAALGSGRSPAVLTVTALTALAAVVLAAALAKVSGGSVPGWLSAIGAVVAFLLAPLACAYGLRTWRGYRAAAGASAAVPLVFVLSVALDGPILQGIGPTVDAVDAVLVPVWLVIFAANLVLST